MSLSEEVELKYLGVVFRRQDGLKDKSMNGASPEIVGVLLQFVMVTKELNQKAKHSIYFNSH